MKNLIAFAAFGALLGCIKPPAIVLVDRATALEQQAAGSFPDLERKLMRNGITAQPVPLTPDQLQALGIRQPPLLDNVGLTEADQVDALLQQRCIGEARDGTLMDTHESCRGAADREAALSLIQRVNLARQQLWRYLQARQPQTPPADLRRTWRQAHYRGVICGGWVQKDDGTWEAKPC
jgi:hypothetical protein